MGTLFLRASKSRFFETLPPTYQYDAFGNNLASTGTTPNVYFYSGERFDSGLGFYDLRARFYRQTTGRFWTRDPIEGKTCCGLSWNPYIYTKDDVVNAIDPTGRDALDEWGFLTPERLSQSTSNVLRLRRELNYLYCLQAAFPALEATWSPDASWTSWEEELFLSDAKDTIVARCAEALEGWPAPPF